jgi:hypothetical protein
MPVSERNRVLNEINRDLPVKYQQEINGYFQNLDRMQNGAQNPTNFNLQNIRNNTAVWNGKNDLAIQQQLANNFNRINP